MGLTILSPWYKWRRSGSNPFDFVGSMEWCNTCTMDVDVDVERGKYEGIYVYRKRCKRCGHVTHWGMDRHLVTNPLPSLMGAVKRWLTTTGADRR